MRTPDVPREASDVTVVVTCYNHQAYVEQCLESIAAQTVAPRQVIVIDDHSRDASAEVITRWLADHQPDWTFIAHSTNLGVCASLNEALTLAEGRYFCQASADDWQEPDRLERQVAVFDEAPASAAFLVGDIREVEAGGGPIVEHDFGPRIAPLLKPRGQRQILTHLLEENSIPAPGVLIRTDLLRAVGGYDESLAFEDYDMWLRLARDHSIAYHAGIVANYRVVASGMTRNTARRATVLGSEADILAKHIGSSDSTDRIIAGRLLGIAGAVLDLGSAPMFRHVLRYAARVSRAPWIRRAVVASRVPGGLERTRRRHYSELRLPKARPQRSVLDALSRRWRAVKAATTPTPRIPERSAHRSARVPSES